MVSFTVKVVPTRWCRWLQFCESENNRLLGPISSFFRSVLNQKWKQSQFTNVAWVRFSDETLYIRWVRCFSTRPRVFPPGTLKIISLQKPTSHSIWVDESSKKKDICTFSYRHLNHIKSDIQATGRRTWFPTLPGRPGAPTGPGAPCNKNNDW